ncbi:transposable element Tcb2 transposase [Trichonephila clavipes]|nr:transposable element Tcb2 transposase [Trichonephila clavipes]
MRVWKQWTDEHRTTRKTGSGRRKLTSARDYRYLLRMAENDRTTSSMQLVAYESRFSLWDHDGRIRVRRYADERYLPECVIERHSGLTSESWFGVRFRIMDDPICYKLMVISIVTDISSIEHAWNLVVRRLARDSRPTASKDELLLRIQAIWNSLPQADIQNLFDSMPRRTVALIAMRGGYTKY